MSSTRHDRNFKSYDSEEQRDESNVVLEPLSDPEFPLGSWQDTAKFFRRRGCTFHNFIIAGGGTEDAVDISSEDHDNVFSNFTVTCGRERALTLKGGSCKNLLRFWVIHGRGRIVEEEFGVWSSSSQQACTGNVCDEHYCADGGSVRYAYVWGSRPQYLNTRTTHVWWWSVCLTLHFWAKYVWHIWLGRPDK